MIVNVFRIVLTGLSPLVSKLDNQSLPYKYGDIFSIYTDSFQIFCIYVCPVFMPLVKTTRNCFVSYHHDNDQKYMVKLRNVIGNVKVADYSLKNDIGHLTDETIYKKVREKMRNCSVTIVLVGSLTGHRKWIDWEIWASLRAYTHPFDPLKSFKPNGLLAIFLPTDSHSVPDRLADNIESGYAVSMKWENLETDFESKVNYAYWNRTYNTRNIRNSRERESNNSIDFLGYKF